MRRVLSRVFLVGTGTEREREKKLWQEKISAEQDYLQAQSALREADIAVRNATQKLAAVGATGSSANLNRFELRAPFDGRVITRDITRGEVVETDQKLFTVANLNDMWVIGNVPEKDVQFIRKDQQVKVVLAAYPHALFTGIITYIGDVLDPATRTMSLRVTVPNPDRLLKPEMFAIVSVMSPSSPDALSVPLAAVQDGPTGKMVFVQQEAGEFAARTVKLGDEDGDVVRVLEGVKAGEQVVTKGSFVLKSEMERHKIESTP